MSRREDHVRGGTGDRVLAGRPEDDDRADEGQEEEKGPAEGATDIRSAERSNAQHGFHDAIVRKTRRERKLTLRHQSAIFKLTGR